MIHADCNLFCVIIIYLQNIANSVTNEKLYKRFDVYLMRTRCCTCFHYKLSVCELPLNSDSVFHCVSFFVLSLPACVTVRCERDNGYLLIRSREVHCRVQWLLVGDICFTPVWREKPVNWYLRQC